MFRDMPVLANVIKPIHHDKYSVIRSYKFVQNKSKFITQTRSVQIDVVSQVVIDAV